MFMYILMFFMFCLITWTFLGILEIKRIKSLEHEFEHYKHLYHLGLIAYKR